jgi:hypothetical protein
VARCWWHYVESWVHHREFRSHSGADTEENLITLCAACHYRLQRHQG